MAQPLKARALYDEMWHAIGGPFSQKIRKQDVLNDVLADFTSMHPWSFLEHGEAYLDLRGTVTLTGWDWTASSLTLTDPNTNADLAAYTWYPGDLFYCSAGGTVGYYKIASKTDDDTLVLETSLSAVNLTAGEVAGTVQPRTVALPSDFREALELGFDTDSSFWYVTLASPETVSRYQRQNMPSLNSFVACVERVVGTDGEVIPLLRIAPPSGSTLVSSLLLVYKRRLAQVTGDGDNVLVPDYCHRLVKDLCRAFAQGLEMPGTYGSRDQLVAAVMAGPTYRNAVVADDGVQTEIGHIKNGHIRRSASALDGSNIATNISIGGPV